MERNASLANTWKLNMTYLETLIDADHPTSYLTVPQAADELGLPVSTLRRAVNCGLVPSYRPFGQRIRVCLSEVVAVIASTQNGGGQDNE